MKRGLISIDGSFISSLEPLVKSLNDSNLSTYNSYLDVMFLDIYNWMQKDSILTIVANDDSNIPVLNILSTQQRETLSELTKEIILCNVTAVRTTIQYFQLILPVEKLSPPLVVSLLRSFGLYDEFMGFPLPVLRKLLRVVVRLYKTKGTKFSAETLLKTLSFAEGSITELYSRNRDHSNIYIFPIEFVGWRRRSDREVDELVFSEDEVVDQRWFLSKEEYRTM